MPHISNHQTSVTYKVVNPKALTQGRLLGQFDASGEWLDGKDIIQTNNQQLTCRFCRNFIEHLSRVLCNS